ncbi:MAG: hypothetical protein PHH26_00610 [Candidatus Thermoplasmatota archaeon]|nr:hypothetical protein [Candidatus Thermoplasmatota archaeon]
MSAVHKTAPMHFRTTGRTRYYFVLIHLAATGGTTTGVIFATHFYLITGVAVLLDLQRLNASIKAIGGG